MPCSFYYKPFFHIGCGIQLDTGVRIFQVIQKLLPVKGSRPCRGKIVVKLNYGFPAPGHPVEELCNGWASQGIS